MHDLAAFTASGVSGGVTPFHRKCSTKPRNCTTIDRARVRSAVTPATRLSAKVADRDRQRSATGAHPNGLGRFVGRQAQLIYDGLRRGKIVLLAGPTGTGKTLAVEEVAQQMPDARLVRIEGKEGLLDVDFLGNIVPREDLRVWQDGPLAEAIQSAQCDPVLLVHRRS